MKELLRELCLTDGISGDECAVRELIIEKIKGLCEYSTDPLGSLICFKKGKSHLLQKGKENSRKETYDMRPHGRSGLHGHLHPPRRYSQL